ncbi:MAG TPA: bleomycin resistance protein [Blastocatellia bacterium]|nr:bleomycin resistance protein [Blastocatellia bacterium]
MTSTNASKNAEAFRVVALSHVNVTVSANAEAAAKEFYGTVLGLKELPKPVGTRQNVGAWYELGGVQLHLSVEEQVTNAASDRHVCYVVADIALAERHLRDSGVEIISDPRPIAGVKRFYVRDPGGNLIEIVQA